VTTQAQGDPEVLKKLGVGQNRAARRWFVRLGIVLVLLAIVAGVLIWRARANRNNVPQYITETVEQGDLNETVTATGTLNPLDAVEVGSEVSGRVIKVNVDINDKVTTGQVLVEIDTETLVARVDEAGAQLRSAQASVTTAKTTTLEAELKAQRMRELHKKGLISDQELEAANAALDRAKAGVRSASAQAAVAQAGVKTAKTSYGKALVKSPIDGIVLARSIEPGATVNAGLQTPVLLTLARDITKMQLKVDVDEADVGKVKDDMPASFVVDAYPKKKFPSNLVRLNNLPKAGTTVITYEALLRVDNTERLLRPGMTATATIITSERKNVLTVPNSALRFTPRAAGDASAKKPSGGSGLPVPGLGGGNRGYGRGMGGGNRPRPASSGGAPPAGSAAAGAGERRGGDKVFVLDNGRPRRISVTVGVTDGKRTEITSDELKPGMEVIIDVAEAPK
jgi:HlyD family secretion protein